MKNLALPLLVLLTATTTFAELPYTGGKTTTHKTGSAAFSQPAANLPLMSRVDFSVGNSFFRNPWVIAPSSTTARDGLGPIFNTNGCQNCHIRDGRGHAPTDKQDTSVSMLIRLSVPAQNQEEKLKQQLYGPLSEPVYGGQLQDFAIPGVQAEGRIEVTWLPQEFTYPDQHKVSLRRPEFKINELAYGSMQKSTLFSARIAPQMIGLGLLESITAADILTNQDIDDANEDGISGKANQVWNVSTQQTELGRFGWKAGMPTLEQQNAGAFNGDLGITSTLFPDDDCTSFEEQCQNTPNGNTGSEKELQANILEAVTFYSRHLAVPMQRNSTSENVIAGEQLFTEIGCESCHIKTFTTPNIAGQPALSNQTFHPFTDLLLHDLGSSLADNRPEYLASGSEWRTPPLWGIGYLTDVNERVALLHDGRAQSVEEAILWHGGEALQSKTKFVTLPKNKRQSLLDFINSL